MALNQACSSGETWKALPIPFSFLRKKQFLIKTCLFFLQAVFQFKRLTVFENDKQDLGTLGLDYALHMKLGRYLGKTYLPFTALG